MAADESTVHDVERRRYRLLVVCSANQCRSPIAEHLWASHLRSSGSVATIRSGGTVAVDGAPATALTIEAAGTRGIDLQGHRSQQMGPWFDLADLIVTMTNEQVRQVVAFDTNLWPRTYPLRDLLRRAEGGPRRPDEPLRTWLERIGGNRRRIELMGNGGPDDIPDPTGDALPAHLALTRDLDLTLQRLTRAAFGHEDGPGRP